MFDAGMNTATLRECLLDLPPLELLGMALLENTAHAGFFPPEVERETLKAAVVKVIEYGERCQQTARRLSHLTPQCPLYHDSTPAGTPGMPNGSQAVSILCYRIHMELNFRNILAL